MGDITSIRVSKDIVRKANSLKKKYGYKNQVNVMEDSLDFFLTNELNPKTTKEPISKLITKTKSDLFALIRAIEKDILLPHYKDFIAVSLYIKDNLDQSKSVVLPEKKEEKTTVVQVKNDSKIKETYNYLYNDLLSKSIEKNGDFIIKKSDLNYFNDSLNNTFKS